MVQLLSNLPSVPKELINAKCCIRLQIVKEHNLYDKDMAVVDMGEVLADLENNY